MNLRDSHRFSPTCEGTLETRLVLSGATSMALASSAAPQTQEAPPTITAANAVRDARGRITSIVLHYSSAMDAATASNENNFVLLQKTVRGRRIATGGFDRVASASYDNVQATTRLVLQRPVPSNYLFVRPTSSRSMVVQLETTANVGLANQDGYRARVS